MYVCIYIFFFLSIDCLGPSISAAKEVIQHPPSWHFALYTTKYEILPRSLQCRTLTHLHRSTEPVLPSNVPALAGQLAGHARHPPPFW